MTPSWFDLADQFCARRTCLGGTPNPRFEVCTSRRYNYAQSRDSKSVRLVFLQGAYDDHSHKTLCRNGRFIWCKKLRYEGLDSEGLRCISFTIGKGQKRFTVCEKNVLCLPSSVYVNNNSYIRNYDKIFTAFASVFCYDKAVRMMFRNDATHTSLENFQQTLDRHRPYKTGTLVAPRFGYFTPNRTVLSDTLQDLCRSYCAANYCHESYSDLAHILSRASAMPKSSEHKNLIAHFFEWSQTTPAALHPYGVILGPARNASGYAGRELYRVNFGGTIYERVHPVQMEIVSEV